MNYYIIYKPYKMISQFTSSHKKKCLDQLDFQFQKDVYPVGRLDENSEGLLILTNDKSLNHKLLKPEFEHKRVYLVQLQGLITSQAIKQLESGITIALDSGPYLTKPCKVKQVKKPENLPPRGHPISDRLPTSWIELTLTEGKFPYVRSGVLLHHRPPISSVEVGPAGARSGRVGERHAVDAEQARAHGLVPVRRSVVPFRLRILRRIPR
ncbi:MAG TPA: pseudouridine synthase, partial [Bacteroidia bacterium]|nr:pseudouridine synthase [Bacteroidia bacterium]